MRNFVLTVVDGLRGDIPGLGHLRTQLSSESPLEQDYSSLKKLFDRGRSFSSWRTTHLQSEPSVASLLTGLYPREHGIFGSAEDLTINEKTLVHHFSERDFHTLLMNGHETFFSNGIASLFDETIMGPPQRFFTRLKTLNEEGKSVFALYETLDLREPYLLSKFPPDEYFHDVALEEANELASVLDGDRKYSRQDVQLLTSDWEIPQAGFQDLPVWKILMDVVHRHYQQDDNPLQDPVDHLVRYYLNTLELLSQNHFSTIDTFLDEDESGEKTSFFITSNSAHGFTQRNGQRTFGARRKPAQDAVTVPALFLNFEKTFPEAPELTSHVDLLPTVLEEFEISADRSTSGTNLFRDGQDHDRIFVEASRSFGERDANDPDKPKTKRSVLSWSGVIDSRGWKVYMRGLPVTEKDLALPLEEFLWTVMAKVTLTSPDEEELEQRAEDFREEDTPEARKELLRRLKKNSDPQFELYNWKEDYFERENELLSDRDEKLNETIDRLVRILNQRFEDPYRLPENESVVRQEPDEVNLLAPMQAVGYVE